MSDLPARLRFFGFTGGDDFPPGLVEALNEAADLIDPKGEAVSDIVDRLRRYVSYQADDYFPGPQLHQTLKDAADRIEYLESVAGAVSQGKDWLAIRKEAGREGSILDRPIYKGELKRDG